MYCIRCGKQIDDNSRICSDCARELALNSQPTAHPASDAPVQSSDNRPVSSESVSQSVRSQASSQQTAPSCSASQSSPVEYRPCAPTSSLMPTVYYGRSEKKSSNESLPGNAKAGLGGAIASVVMSDIGCTLASVSIYFALIAIELGYLMLFSALPLLIISLIQGIKSIRIYRQCISSGCKKPVATLVLGIIGLVASAIGLLLVMLYALALLSPEFYKAFYDSYYFLY